MKSVYIWVLVLVVASACSAKQEITDSAEEQATGLTTEITSEDAVKLAGNFGEVITEEGAISSSDLLDQLAGQDSVSIKLKSEILATCAMKGCWMNVTLDANDQMRVTFKDYGFFVPKEGVEGKEVIIEGYAKKVTTDVETLQHFAKDAGKSQGEIDAITEPKEEVTFIASGVIIKE